MMNRENTPLPETTKLFGNFNVRILRKGERYGLNDCLTHDEEAPLVEFYDFRYHNDDDWKRGQFVSRYYAETLFENVIDRYLYGLQLYGEVPEWTVPQEQMRQIMHWLESELPEFRLTAKQLSDLNFRRGRFEADRIQNGLARALIRAVKNDGHGKCYLGKFNTDKPGLIEYRKGRIYNFSCDFVIPEFDEAVQRWLLEYHDESGNLKPVQDIIKRLDRLHGYSVFWS